MKTANQSQNKHKDLKRRQIEINSQKSSRRTSVSNDSNDDAPTGPVSTVSEFGTISSVSCEEALNSIKFRFFDDDFFGEEINKEDYDEPPLETVRINYDYEAYFLDSKTRTEALDQVETQILKALGIKSALVDSLGEPSEVICEELFSIVLSNDDPQRVLKKGIPGESWDYFFGWDSSPSDVEDISNAACVAKPPKNVDDKAICTPISGAITAQVPTLLKLDHHLLEMQVLKFIKTEMDKDVFVTDSVPGLKFIGLRQSVIDTGGVGTDDTRDVLTQDTNQYSGVIAGASVQEQVTESKRLTDYGISFVTLLVASAIVVGSLMLVKMRNGQKRRREKEKQLNKAVQDDSDGFQGQEQKCPGNERQVNGIIITDLKKENMRDDVKLNSDKTLTAPKKKPRIRPVIPVLYENEYDLVEKGTITPRPNLIADEKHSKNNEPFCQSQGRNDSLLCHNITPPSRVLGNVEPRVSHYVVKKTSLNSVELVNVGLGSVDDEAKTEEVDTSDASAGFLGQSLGTWMDSLETGSECGEDIFTPPGTPERQEM